MSETYDLAIIGGGINGAATARDAALRGLKVILFEQHDFAFGASSKSSKLAHGGLRYLEQFQFGLVRESLKERALLVKNAPHLVRPLPFIFPVYEKTRVSLWKMKLGLYIYDFLARSPLFPKHKNLKKKEILKEFPTINEDNLISGCLYYDALMNDARIVIENILSAEQAGAAVYHYTQVTGFTYSNQKINGVNFQHVHTLKTGHIHANVVVNTTGAWINEVIKQDLHSPSGPLVEPTKGVHLIIPQIHDTYALILLTPQDSRVFFVIPWNGNSLLGTTDTFYDNDPNRVYATPEDTNYLMDAYNHYFPNAKITENQIIASFAGLRPLVRGADSSPSKLSRDHVITTSPSGLITLAGGKYTTYRKMAENVVKKVIKDLKTNLKLKPCMTKKVPLHGGEAIDADTAALASKYSLALSQINRLISTYGSAYPALFQLMDNNPDEKKPICSKHPHLLAEVTYAIKMEKALSLEDWYMRRTSIAYTECQGIDCLKTVASHFAKLLQWDEKRLQNEIGNYISQALWQNYKQS